jgi:hypothetical protein
MPFDTISLGIGRQLSVAEFLALPLDERVRSILNREIQFFRGDEPVDRALALKSLMAAFRKGPPEK